MLYKNGLNLKNSLLDFVKKSNKLSIYIPYIKLQQLEYLLASSPKIDTVIVRWEPNDLILGSSDLEVYLFLKERNIKLYRNPRLHLKAFIDCDKRAYIGSANISQRALNLPETPNFNYELGIIVENLSFEDRIYFQKIIFESTLITDENYAQLKYQLEKNNAIFPESIDFDLVINQNDKSFMISSLPMSYSVDTFIKVYKNESSVDEFEVNCVLHDLALYNIPLGLEKSKLLDFLKSCFFNHPFINAFIKNFDSRGEIYFGEAKEWIQKNCTDIPAPKKWEITNTVQILFRWMVYLGDNIYTLDRPNYSQRLKIIRK